MAGDSTFEELWRKIRIYAPDLPVSLAQEFVNTGYLRALTVWDWSGLRGEVEYAVPAVVTAGTVSLTQGSTAVVATDNIFGALNASAGMQFQPQGFGAYYTIVSNADATNAVLDRAYAYPSNATSAYQLGKFYLDMPADFGSMSDIRHLNYNWRLRIGFTQETLDLFDAQRVSAGTPSLVAGASYHPTTGVARFELWSKPTGVGQFAMRYVKKPSKLSGSTSIMEPLRGDVIINAALADVARWPGTSGLKNPMFDLNAYRMYDERFREGLQECWMKDIERNQTMVSYDQWSQLPYAPVDAKFVQNHFIF